MGFQLVHSSTPSVTSNCLQYNCQIAQANSLEACTTTATESLIELHMYQALFGPMTEFEFALAFWRAYPGSQWE